MNENKVPTYGAFVSSMDYDAKLRRHQWFRRNKTKLMAGGVVLLATVVIVAVISLI